MHALFWFYFGVFDFSCKYLMFCSFRKLDVSKSYSCFLWIPPTPSSLTVHDIKLSSSSVFTFLFFSIYCSVLVDGGVILPMAKLLGLEECGYAGK